MKAILVSGPTDEPVTLDELKRQASVSHDEHDTLLALYITAAREAVEKHTGLLLGEQVWDVYMSGPGQLPIEPVNEVLSVAGQWGAGVTLETPFSFEIDGGGLTMIPVAGAERYIARVNAGIPTGSTPGALRTAMLMLATSMYEDRGAQVPTSIMRNPALEFMLFPFRHNLGV